MLTTTGERALAYTVKVDEIIPIPGVDKKGNPYTKVEYARVGGWWVVVKAGDLKVNDIAIYVEIDSILPEWPEFEFLRSKKFRIKTQKMCGVLSQGILFSVGINGVISEERAKSFLGEEFFQSALWARDSRFPWEIEGYNVTDLLQIKKYEPPEDKRFLPGSAKGYFPSFLKKTDQERIQNLDRVISTIPWDYEVTEKLDGSSMTVYYRNGEVGVCSRKMELKSTPPEKERWNEGAFWKTAKKLNLTDIVAKIYQDTGKQIALQGELVGPGIQKNKYKLDDFTWCCFDIWSIDENRYLLPKERREICLTYEIPHVPTLDGSFTDIHWQNFGIFLTDVKLIIQFLLKFAEGKTLFGNNPNQEREGYVFKHNAQPFSFKTINNKFLLEEK